MQEVDKYLNHKTSSKITHHTLCTDKFLAFFVAHDKVSVDVIRAHHTVHLR